MIGARIKTQTARRGQALVEVMVAISVLTIGFLGIITLLSRALSLNRVVADNYVATYLAAEGIELSKNIIDGNLLQGRQWNDALTDGDYEVEFTSPKFLPPSGQALSFDPGTGLYSYSGTSATGFKRRISIALVGQNEIQVNAEVTWPGRGGGTSRVDLEDHFFNWRQQ